MCVYTLQFTCVRGWVGAGRSSAAAPAVGKNIDGDSDEMQRRSERARTPFARVTKGQQTRRSSRSHLPWNASPGQINGKRENLIKVGASTRSIHAAGPRIEWVREST